jgi:predicted nucleic acid-binding protein
VAGSIFLDTAGWFAALSPPEAGHARAKSVYVDAVRRGMLLVTTPLVAAEMHALLVRWRGPRAGALFLETVFETGAHVVAAMNDDLFDAALSRWIRKFADKPISFTDAVSFEVMRRERVAQALTFDRHFRDAGFEILA